MDSSVYIEQLLAKSRAAQAIYASFSQQQVDNIVKGIGKIIYENRETLSRNAADETGIGVFESKVAKHVAITVYEWNFLKDKKSVGIIDRDDVAGVITYAKPMGVVGCITPSTNPTSNPAGISMNVLKGCNSIIIAPHPRAKNCTKQVVALMNQVVKENGGPDFLIQCIEEPTIELTTKLMASVDMVIATGGFGMVKAAYSCGKPSLGVGQGNVQCIFVDDYDDLTHAAKTVIGNRAYDNGIPVKRRAKMLSNSSFCS